MYRIGLNLAKKDNFMFFDFDAPLCLSITQNTGVAAKLTPNILRGLKSKALLDLDGTIDLKSGTDKVIDIKEPIEEVIIPPSNDMLSQESPVDITAEDTDTIVETEVPAKKPRGRKAKGGDAK